MFNTPKGEYEEPLKRSGYSSISLSFHQSSKSHVKRQCHRNIIWFNPSYSGAVITNVCREVPLTDRFATLTFEQAP